jgi:esterase/lipase superfamily enzyme
MLFAVGQGPWEDNSLSSVRFLEYIFRDKGIPAKVEYWGNDVSHDWYWWFKMVQHYLPKFLH